MTAPRNAAFNSIMRMYRSVFKPGVSSMTPPATITPISSYYRNNENADALSDHFGNQWVRDANLPLPFSDPEDVTNVSDREYFLVANRWSHFINQSVGYLGHIDADGGSYTVCGIFQIIAMGGDPAIAWDADELYLQAFYGATGAPPVGASVPDFVMPVPRPPNVLSFIPGPRTPLNSGFSLSRGITLAFSSTRDTYTAGGPGTFHINWSLYQVTLTDTGLSP